MGDLTLTAEQEREVDRQLEIIRRGTAEIVPAEELEHKVRRSVATGKPLIVKLGFDPTGADLTLGHTVVLQKMRQFQDLGHRVCLLIGDFTGMVGDPTDKSETRKQLTREQVMENERTYSAQAFRILDSERTEIVYNSRWLAPLTFADVLGLASKITVARMLERDDFRKRFNNNLPLTLTEFFYPLMQGYDSVAMKSDIELGGTDQKFNLLMGRMLQKEFDQEPQVTVITPLLEGLDGVHKMSKSLGNYIGISESPNDMYGKAMSIPDELMLKYFELVTDVSMERLAELKEGLASGQLHPRDVKMNLAYTLVRMYHDEKTADDAQAHFRTVFQQRELPVDLPEVRVSDEPIWIVKLLVETGLVPSNGEGRRMIQQGGVKIDGVKIGDESATITCRDGMVLQVGKRKFARLHV